MKKYLTLFLFLTINFSFAQKKQIIITKNAPIPTAPYSQAVKANGMVYLAGQIGLNPENRKLVEGGVEAEANQIMLNIGAVLNAAGLGYEDIVNTNIYLKDISKFSVINEIYGKFFKSDFPARTTVGVFDLPGGASIEIAVIAIDKKK